MYRDGCPQDYYRCLLRLEQCAADSSQGPLPALDQVLTRQLNGFYKCLLSLPEAWRAALRPGQRQGYYLALLNEKARQAFGTVARFLAEMAADGAMMPWELTSRTITASNQPS